MSNGCSTKWVRELMGQTLQTAAASHPVSSLDGVGPKQAKAGLHGTSGDQRGPGFGSSMADAIIRHYGGVKEAAYALHVDRSLMMREFKAGDFGRFDEHADEIAKSSVVRYLAEVFADLMTPMAKLHRDLDAIVRR